MDLPLSRGGLHIESTKEEGRRGGEEGGGGGREDGRRKMALGQLSEKCVYSNRVKWLDCAAFEHNAALGECE